MSEKVKKSNSKEKDLTSLEGDVIDIAPEQVRYVENKEKKETDTEIGATGETSIGKKEKGDATKLNSLFEDKKQIERELSKEGLTREEKEVWEEQKKSRSIEILKQECKILGKDFKEVEAEMAREKEGQWRKNIAIMGYESEADYDKARSTALENKLFGNLLKDNLDLSKGQLKFLIENPNGSIQAGGEFTVKRITLDRDDVAICTHLGIDIHDISFGAFGFSKKIHAGNGRSYKNIREFNSFLKEEKEKYLLDKTAGQLDKTKQSIKDNAIGPYVLESQIKKMHEAVLAQQNIENQVKKDKVKKEKLEKAPILSDEQKKGLLEDFKNKWSEARENSREIKDTIFLGDDDYDYSESELLYQNGKISNDIISIAEELSGRDLHKEANVKYEGRTQKEFRKYLTEESLKIFNQQKNEIADRQEKISEKLAEEAKEETRKKNSEEADKGIQDIYEALKNDENPIVLSDKEEGLTPKQTRPGVKMGVEYRPVNLRALPKEELVNKLEDVLSQKFLNSLTGDIKKDSEKLSDFFKYSLGEKVPAEKFKKLISEKRYEVAVNRSVTNKTALAGKIAEIFLARGWDKSNKEEK